MSLADSCVSVLTFIRHLDSNLNMKIQDVFEALSDPNRRAILDLLKKGEMSVGEIAENFEITGASLSHHLNKLKAADLVVSRRRGQTIIYAIHTSVFEDVSGLLLNLFSVKGKKNETSCDSDPY